MRRSRRKTSGLQAAAVAAVCILFVMTALIGLYKCFSKEPVPQEDTPGSRCAQAPEETAATRVCWSMISDSQTWYGVGSSRQGSFLALSRNHSSRGMGSCSNASTAGPPISVRYAI